MQGKGLAIIDCWLRLYALALLYPYALNGIFQTRQQESLLYINFSRTPVTLYSCSIFNNHIFIIHRQLTSPIKNTFVICIGTKTHGTISFVD
jgi:hypothetical protein